MAPRPVLIAAELVDLDSQTLLIPPSPLVSPLNPRARLLLGALRRHILFVVVLKDAFHIVLTTQLNQHFNRTIIVPSVAEDGQQLPQVCRLSGQIFNRLRRRLRV